MDYIDGTNVLPYADQGVADVKSTLQECAANVHERQAQLRSELAARIASALREDTGSADLTALYALAHTAQLPPADEGQPPTYEQEAVELLRELQAASEELCALQVHERLRTVHADLQERVQEFYKRVAEGTLQDAAWCVKALGKLLEDLQTELCSESDGPGDASPGAAGTAGDADTQAGAAALRQRMLEHVRQTHNELCVHLQEALNGIIWGSIFYCEFAAGAPLLQCSTSFASRGVWDTAQLADVLEPFLDTLSAVVLEYVVKPLIAQSAWLVLQPSMYSAVPQDSEPPGEAGAEAYAILTPVERAAGGAAAEAPQQGSGDDWDIGLAALAEFLQTHVFGGQQPQFQQFMEAFWPQCAEACAAPRHSEGGDNASAQRQLKAAKGVEKHLQQQGMLRAGGAAWEALSSALAVHERLLLQHFQLPFLQAARLACCRATLWSDDSAEHVMLAGSVMNVEAFAGAPGVQGGRYGSAAKTASDKSVNLGWPAGASVLGQGQYVIWKAADRLVAVATDVAKSLTPTSTDLESSAAYQTIDDMACMYTAMVTVGGKPFSGTRRCLVHANSASHIAQALLLLPLTLPRHLPCYWAFQRACVQAAASLASSADGLRYQLMRKQGAKIRKCLQGSPHLTNLNGTSALAARKVVQQAATSIRSCSEQLAQTCCARDHALLLSGLIASVCEYIEAKICSIKDIGEADSEEILRIISPLWSDVLTTVAAHFCTGVRTKFPKLAPSLPSHEVEQVVDMLRNMCLPARKLQVLGELLSARLAAFVDGWKSGKLTELGFTCKQLSALIAALFEDNPYRRECLAEIKALAT